MLSTTKRLGNSVLVQTCDNKSKPHPGPLMNGYWKLEALEKNKTKNNREHVTAMRKWHGLRRERMDPSNHFPTL